MYILININSKACRWCLSFFFFFFKGTRGFSRNIICRLYICIYNVRTKVNEIAYILGCLRLFEKIFKCVNFRIFIFRIYEDTDYESNIENV